MVNYIVLADYLNHTVQVKGVSGGGYSKILTYLQELYNANPSQFSSNYLGNNSPLPDFDQNNIYPNYRGVPKAPISNGKIDGIIIIWTKHPSFGTASGDGYTIRGYNNSSILGFTGVENMAAFTGQQSFIIQEYFHGLYGGNEYHTGAGAGDHTFMTRTNPFGISSQVGGAGISQAAIGWDRDRLGWYGWKDLNQSVRKTHLISALDVTGNEVNTNYTIASDLGNGLFVLRDHVLYGDAIRIKLPHLQDDPTYPNAKNQYLWIENHQRISQFDVSVFESNSCKEATLPGMWAYIQVGKDVKEANNIYNPNADHPNGLGSFIFPLTAEGNYDFVYRNPHKPGNVGCAWENETVVIDKYNPNTLPNTFIGFNDLYNVYNSNGDNIISKVSGDIYEPRHSEYINGTTVYNLLSKGDNDDAYNMTTGKTRLSIATNPAPTPVYTYKTDYLNDKTDNSIQHKQSYENRSVWLNGISVEIVQENYAPTLYGQGAILVQVRTDNYDVDQDARWCGNIKVSPNDFDPTPTDFLDNKYAVNIKSGTNILLDRSRSYTRHYAVDQEPVTNTYRFSEPTEMTILPNAYFHMENNTSMVIDGESTVRIKNNGRLEVHRNSTVTVKKGSKLILEPGAQLVIWDDALVKIEEGAVLEYENADINLVRNTAVLEFEGDLKIADNADFTFRGNGYLRFSQQGEYDPITNPSNIIPGIGSTITLRGNNELDKVLEVTQKSMICFEPLAKFTLENGVAELAPSARICVSTDLDLNTAKITSSTGEASNHRGLCLYGQPNVSINNCTFEYGKYGIYATLTYGGNQLFIFNSKFLNNEIGLYTIDKGVSLINNIFLNNQVEGWRAVGMTFPSTSFQNTINLNGLGVNFNATGTSSLLVNGSTISNNNANGILFDGPAMLTTYCGEISRNGINSFGSGILFSNNAILNNSPDVQPAGGSTNISGNYNAVNPVCANNWYLTEGKNNFSSINQVANGDFNLNCNSTGINGRGNQWKPINSAPSYNIDYSLLLCNCTFQTAFYLTDNSPVYHESCSKIQVDGLSNLLSPPQGNPLTNCSTCEEIITADFQQVKMNTAINTALLALATADSKETVYKAMSMLNQIISYVYGDEQSDSIPATEEELWLLEYAYSQIKSALGSGIQNNTIEAQGSSPAVTLVFEAIQALSEKPEFVASQDKQVYFKLDKASVYKVINDREKALQEIDALNGCYALHDEQKKYISELRKVIYVEQLLYSNQINKEEFATVYESLANANESFYDNGIFVLGSDQMGNIQFANTPIEFKSIEISNTTSWDFGDCQTANGNTVTHTYTQPGTYNIKLTQVYACTTQNKTLTVTVLPAPTTTITAAIMSGNCESTAYLIDLEIQEDYSAPACFGNASNSNINEDIRVKLSWDFDLPSKSDYSEYLTYDAFINAAYTPFTLSVPLGTTVNMSVTTVVQLLQNGEWQDTKYTQVSHQVIFDREIFSAQITMDSLPCLGDSTYFEAQLLGGTAPYQINWDFGEGEVDGSAVYHAFTNSGENSFFFDVVDANGCVAYTTFPQGTNHIHENDLSNVDEENHHGTEFTVEISDCSLAALDANKSRRQNNMNVVEEKVAGINNLMFTSEQIHFYPNPNSGDKLFVQTPFYSDVYFTLSSMDGRKVHEEELISNNQVINLPNDIKNGVYLCTIKHSISSASIQKKILIVK